MTKHILLIIIFITTVINIKAQQVEPPFWWTGMKQSQIQLMVHKKMIAQTIPQIKSKSVTILRVHHTDNPNYLFIDLKINATAKAGTFTIKFIKGHKQFWQYKYELKNRAPKSEQREGFNNSDVLYLIMPDRFSNGDTSNDSKSSMLEKANRKNPNGRHGGDIKGIINHLDYFNTLGVSALWINPLLENNMNDFSYHGYAITNYYKVDPRFGSNQDYVNLVDSAKNRHLKVIMDMVFNHCGINHWWMKDLPSKDWIHHFEKFTQSNYRAEALMDPHASNYDKMIMSNGWFDKTMPDLNQKNPFLANYLIQNSIWWIEYAGLSGIRMDTYPYSDQKFMNQWLKAVYTEYPNFNIVGETWLQTVPQTAYFQTRTFPLTKKTTELGSLTDFPLCYAINNSLNENDGWTQGLAKLYMTLSQDFTYSNADSNLIFLENHDINRFATNIHSDMAKWKMGMTFLLTSRGIPMLYYGGELMTTGDKSKGDADLRRDFPGGWEGDSINAFKQTNLDSNQREALRFTRMLLKLRDANKALQSGKLIQYIPNNNAYVYFRIGRNKVFMIVMHNAKGPLHLDLKKYTEIIGKFSKLKRIGSANYQQIPQAIDINGKKAVIFQFE